MGLCKFSSKKTKKRIFSDLGFNIHGELVENIYDLLFERATIALFSELSTAGFSIYDFFGDKIIEIKNIYSKYFEISDNCFKLTKSTWLNKYFFEAYFMVFCMPPNM